MTTTAVTDRLTRGRDFLVGYVMQTDKGSLNASPVFAPVRRSSGKPKVALGYVQDDTIQVNNEGQQNIQDTIEYTVDIEASASKQSITLMKQAIHGDQVAYTLTAATFAALVDGFTFTAASYAAMTVGDGFWISGFADSDIDGFYIVSSKEASNKIVTTIAPAATEATGASVTVISNRTVNADLPSYNMVQRRTTDLSAVGDISYLTLYDAVIDTFSIDIAETGIVKTKAAFKAEKRVAGDLLIPGQTYSAVATDNALSAVQNILGFYVDGISYTCIQKKLSIEIANGYSGDDAAACARQFARGQFEVKGSVSFRSRISSTLDWEAIYLAGTKKQIGVLISHSSTEQTYITMEQTVMTEHSQADGANDVASHELSFGAEGDATIGSTIGIFTNW